MLQRLWQTIIPLGIPLSWLNLIKEKKRFLAAVAGITFAVAMMLFQLGLHSALFNQVIAPMKVLNADVVIVNTQYEYFGISRNFTERRLTQAAAFPQVESVSPLYLINLPMKNPLDGQNRDIFILGFDPSTHIFDDAQIEGWQEMLKVPGNAIFDRLSNAQFGPIGQLLAQDGKVRTEVNGQAVEIIGEFSMGTTFAADGNLIVSKETFFHIMRGANANLLAVGLVKLKAGSDTAAVVKALQEYLPDDVQVMSMAAFKEKEQTYWGKRTPIGFVITASMLVSMIVGAVIVYQILYTDVTDHLEEYATLKSIGFRDRYFVGLILQESVILSVFGFVPGAALTNVLYYFTRTVAFMPTYWSWLNATLVFALTLGMCLVAGGFATRKLRHANPSEIF